MRRLVLLLMPVALGREPEPAPLRDLSGWTARVDWGQAEQEAVELLSAYIAVDTSNPPGNELAGAELLAQRLRAEGVEPEVIEYEPGRANLIARIPGAAGSGAEAPLCLLHHIDVVTADAASWTHPPLSGEIDAEGRIWGRGALDMKSVGVIQFLSALWLKRLGVPLRRDVVLLAVSDEEIDNGGVKWLAEHRWKDIGCSQLLNEGGFGIRDAMFEGLTTFTVSFSEKGALWVRLVARGLPGHGSTPLPDTAPMRLLQALDRVRQHRPEPRFHPELYKLLQAIGEKVGGLKGAVLKSPSLTRSLATAQLMDNPLSAAILTDTINITGFGGALEPNVVPEEVWAQLDVRLLPGTRSADMLARLRALVADVPEVRVEVISALEAEESPTDDPLFQAVLGRLGEAWPEAAVGPFIMMGTTDSQVLRPLGVHCYGIAPFVLAEPDLRGMHGNDEHIHRDNLGRGLEVMFSIVLDAAAR